VKIYFIIFLFVYIQCAIFRQKLLIIDDNFKATIIQLAHFKDNDPSFLKIYILGMLMQPVFLKYTLNYVYYKEYTENSNKVIFHQKHQNLKNIKKLTEFLYNKFFSLFTYLKAP